MNHSRQARICRHVAPPFVFKCPAAVCVITQWHRCYTLASLVLCFVSSKLFCLYASINTSLNVSIKTEDYNFRQGVWNKGAGEHIRVGVTHIGSRPQLAGQLLLLRVGGGHLQVEHRLQPGGAAVDPLTPLIILMRNK